MVELDLLTIGFLGGAALLAGAVNAVAGGGSLISFPALVAAGYPSLTANATNIVAVLPGYLGGSVAYRRELRGQGPTMAALAVTSGVGALAGAVLLVVSPAGLFEAIAPFLILVACGALAVQPLLERVARGRDERTADHRSAGLHAFVFAAAVYGGYFGAALGIMLLAILAPRLTEMQDANALKGVLSLVIGLVSAIYLLLFGPVVLIAAAIMAGGSLFGGYGGVALARRLPGDALRWVVVGYGVAVAVVLLAT